MTDEIKSLIEDAAKLLGLPEGFWHGQTFLYKPGAAIREFNPLDLERGDLRKVMEAADLRVDFFCEEVTTRDRNYAFGFAKGDYQSLALAILRAASAVLKARNENDEF